MRPRREHKLLETIRPTFGPGGPQGHVLAAVSGGSDSSALLALLAAAREIADFELTAVYIDHGLRATTPEESAHVERLASRLGASFVAAAIETPVNPSEAALRSARYAVLEQIAGDNACDWVATGHTRDDQIETILFRFLRGSSRKGLSGIPVRRARIVRPLLSLGRAELQDYLRSREIEWIEDPSNHDPRYARNRLRHTVIPTLAAALGRGRLEHLPEVAQLWSAEDDYLETEAARFAAFAVRRRDGRDEIDLTAYETIPVALRPRVLRRWLAASGLAGEIDLARLRALASLAGSQKGSARLRFGKLEISREYDRLRVSVSAAAAPLEGFEIGVSISERATYDDPGGRWRIEVEPGPMRGSGATARPGADVVEFPDGVLPSPLVLRDLRPGDAMRISGRGTRKVRDMMIEMRVPERQRSHRPVLAARGRIIWVPGLAVADDLESASPDRACGVRFAWSDWHV